MSLWPSHYGVADDHCGDVILGAYDVPVEAMTVIDIGANVGAFVRWGRTRWPHAAFHCFEPNLENYRLLLETVAGLPNHENIYCHPVAVLDHSDVLNLFPGKCNCGEWSLFGGPDRANGIPVQVMDAVIIPSGDVLKIDTEGGEPFILKRLAQLGRLKEFSAVMLEYHRAGEDKSITELMVENGFKLHAHKEGPSESRGELKFIR